jgi:hypothetical protein
MQLFLCLGVIKLSLKIARADYIKWHQAAAEIRGATIVTVINDRKKEYLQAGSPAEIYHTCILFSYIALPIIMVFPA